MQALGRCPPPAPGPFTDAASGPTSYAHRLPADASAPLRIARPTGDPDAVARFRLDGLGLAELWRHECGVTVEDPDGYRLVLSTRGWSNAPS
ncbi:hypothetical protein [Streptomyces sp. NPDC056600]|uniref:hypothetical protein n=1 Tax=Streptomyces sp. NPDC056600 TaxID=3345874 RepID=UPI00369364E8